MTLPAPLPAKVASGIKADHFCPKLDLMSCFWQKQNNRLDARSSFTEKRFQGLGTVHSSLPADSPTFTLSQKVCIQNQCKTFTIGAKASTKHQGKRMLWLLATWCFCVTFPWQAINSDPCVCSFSSFVEWLFREGCQKSKWKFKMAFAIRRPPPPPLNGTNFQTFFTPLFFFCNWILHIWNGFYTSKISLLSPLIIGSKLTFISGSGRWLPTIEPCSKSSQLLYIHNIKPKLSAKHVFTVREWF